MCYSEQQLRTVLFFTLNACTALPIRHRSLYDRRVDNSVHDVYDIQFHKGFNSATTGFHCKEIYEEPLSDLTISAVVTSVMIFTRIFATKHFIKKL